MQYLIGACISLCIALSLFMDRATYGSWSMWQKTGFCVALGGFILGIILFLRSKNRIHSYEPTALLLLFLGLMLLLQAHGDLVQTAFGVIAIIAAIIAFHWAELPRAANTPKQPPPKVAEPSFGAALIKARERSERVIEEYKPSGAVAGAPDE